MQAPTHILVIRLSSLGDVAMTVPVLRDLLLQYPHIHITVVSAAFMRPLFEGLDRCRFHPAFLKGQHKGIAGIFRLYKELRILGVYDAVADLHNVLRSKLLGAIFRLTGTKIATIDKGRAEKKALTRKENKECRQLTTTHERYAKVFAALGIAVNLQPATPVYARMPVPTGMEAVFSSGKRVIGIAPFAQYKEKMYPLEKMKAIVRELAAANYTILLFGSSGEATVLQEWEQEIFSVFNIAGRFTLKDELAIISNLQLMVSMDSANMHLASLYNVPVVSVWGATHRYAGFYGWAQDVSNIAEIALYCRPCSVFGNKPCYRGDHACMNWLAEELVLQKISGAL